MRGLGGLSPEHGLSLLYGNRPVVDGFNRHVEIARVRQRVGVNVPVNVAGEPPERSGVDGNVRHYHIVDHAHAVDLLESGINVVACFEHVVIAAHESLVAVQASTERKVLAAHSHVAKMINVVLWPNDCVPCGNHGLVHLCRVSERSPAVPDDVLMREVRIADEEDCSHLIYTDTDQPHPKPSAVLAGLFLRALLMSLLQSAGIVLLARGSLLSIGTAFLISALWIGNARVSVDHRIRFSRLAYGAGGAAGAGLTLLVAWWTG